MPISSHEFLRSLDVQIEGEKFNPIFLDYVLKCDIFYGSRTKSRRNRLHDLNLFVCLALVNSDKVRFRNRFFCIDKHADTPC